MREFRLLLLVAVLSSCVRGADVNLALYRSAEASSSYDHNLTAQLLTDGIVEAEMPAFLEVESSEEGLIGRVERENCLDGDTNSRNIITGDSGWISFRPSGYEIDADKAEVLCQEALGGGHGGPQMTFAVPVERDGAGALRLSLSFPHEGRWRVKEVTFSRQGEPVMDVLPSEHFSSSWLSSGGEEEWVKVDLGNVRMIREIRPHWLQEPESYVVEVSRDGERWKEVSGGCCGRFVRLKMKGSGERFCMTELEVLGPETGKAQESGWMVRRDCEGAAWQPATVPGTVLASFIKAGAVPDPDYGDGWEQISESYFLSDFLYRKDLGPVSVSEGKRALLEFDGINWKAEVRLNGSLLGRIDGAFLRSSFDVTSLLEAGHNILEVKILRNANPGAVKEKTARWTGYNGGVLGKDSPTFLCSIGWDWLTTIRGRNIGIWDEVRLVEKGPVTVSDPMAASKVSEDGRASMTASVFVKGVSGQAEVEGWIGDIRFSKTVSADGEVVFSPEDFPQLKDAEIDLWWPNEYGEPVLHDAGFVVREDGGVSDSLSYKAGIREIGWSEEDGSLRLYVNGRRIVPHGGNWGFAQQNLIYSPEQFDAAVSYHRQMHMNMIRNWVGQVAGEAFYDACDRHGILVWQEFPLANPADGPDPDDEAMFLANARDRVLRLRRHPSIALWCGRNEGFPPASLDAPLRETVQTLFPGIPYLSSSADGAVSGHGPYHALPAEYYFSHQSGKLHSERGLPNVPTWESLCRMMPPEDRWPIGEMWGKHDFTEVGAQKTTTYINMVKEAFGEYSSAEEFCALSQWINYDSNRAIFESANSAGRMGLILWMTHAAWPSLVFCTYDYYFEPGGAFFGCKKGCEPVHIQYNALSRQTEVVNLCGGDLAGLTAGLRIFGYRGNLISEQSVTLDSPDDSTTPLFEAHAPSGEPVYYLSLTLRDASDKLLSENFYALGAERGNLRALRSLPSANISYRVSRDGDGLTVTLRNETDTPALLVRLILLDRNGEEILPVNYSDNYFSLMPGDGKTVRVEWGGDPSKAGIAITQLGDFQREKKLF